MPQIIFTLKSSSNKDEMKMRLTAANEEVPKVTDSIRKFATDATVQILEDLGGKSMMVILWNEGLKANPFCNEQDAIASLGMDGTIWQDYNFIH
jgi:hypothetical protein